MWSDHRHLVGSACPRTLSAEAICSLSLVCCSPWGHGKSDTTEQLNNNSIVREGRCACWQGLSSWAVTGSSRKPTITPDRERPPSSMESSDSVKQRLSQLEMGQKERISTIRQLTRNIRHGWTSHLNSQLIKYLITKKHVSLYIYICIHTHTCLYTWAHICASIRVYMQGSVAKNPPAMQKTMQVLSLGQEDPLEEGMATHCSILAWRISMDRGA